MEYRQKSGLILFFSMAASILLSRLSLGVVLFPLPLLAASYRIEKTGLVTALQAGTLVAVVLWQLLPSLPYMNTANAGIIMLGVLFQVMSGLTALVYTLLRNYSTSVLRRFVVAGAPVALVGAVFLVWLNGNEAVAGGILEAFSNIIPEEVMGFDAGFFGGMMLLVANYGAIPIGMMCGAIPVLVAETGLHRFDSRWQADFAMMKIPRHYVWAYIGLWAVFALSFISPGKGIVRMLGFNLAVGFSLHYLLNGISILLAWIRRRYPAFPAGTLVLLVFVAGIIPVFNAAVFGLTVLLGVLEAFVDLR